MSTIHKLLNITINNPHLYIFKLTQAKIHRGQSSISEENEMADDIIPMPPWTLLLPSTFGGPNIICIPKDIGIQNLEIPPHVRHVSLFLQMSKDYRVITDFKIKILKCYRLAW